MSILAFRYIGVCSILLGAFGLFATSASANTKVQAQDASGALVNYLGSITTSLTSVPLMAQERLDNCRRTIREADIFVNQADNTPDTIPLQPNVTVELAGARYQPEVVERVQINTPVVGWVEARGLAMCSTNDPSNCRRITRSLMVFESQTAPSPNTGLSLQPNANVSLTGERYSPPRIDRVLLRSPVAGWVDASNLGMCSPSADQPPTPTPQTALSVRACAVVNPVLDGFGGLAVRNAAPEQSTILDSLPGNTPLVLSSQSQTLASGRVVTRIIRPNREQTNRTTPYPGTSWWIYESGPTGIDSGLNITQRPCNQLFQEIKEGQTLSL